MRGTKMKWIRLAWGSMRMFDWLCNSKRSNTRTIGEDVAGVGRCWFANSCVHVHAHPSSQWILSSFHFLLEGLPLKLNQPGLLLGWTIRLYLFGKFKSSFPLKPQKVNFLQRGSPPSNQQIIQCFMEIHWAFETRLEPQSKPG